MLSISFLRQSKLKSEQNRMERILLQIEICYQINIWSWIYELYFGFSQCICIHTCVKNSIILTTYSVFKIFVEKDKDKYYVSLQIYLLISNKHKKYCKFWLKCQYLVVHPICMYEKKKTFTYLLSQSHWYAKLEKMLERKGKKRQQIRKLSLFAFNGSL